LQGQIKEIFRFIVFILLAIYIVPIGFLMKKHEEKWQALWKKRDKSFLESLKFSLYLFLYIPNALLFYLLESPWRDKISVFKL
jgi:ABC-type sulfate transport system permease component